MCTLYIFSAEVKSKFIDQITKDWKNNNDGGSCIMLDEYDDVYVRIQCTELKHLVAVLKSSKAARYCVHLRAATTSAMGVTGCHFFDSPNGEFIYAHNGVISDGNHLRVDSLIVGEWLENDKSGMPDMSAEYYANLIVYDTLTKKLTVHRCGGSLYTDNRGNWSTTRLNQHFHYVCSEGWYGMSGKQMVVYPAKPKFYTLGKRKFSFNYSDADVYYRTKTFKPCLSCGESSADVIYNHIADCDLCLKCERRYFTDEKPLRTDDTTKGMPKFITSDSMDKAEESDTSSETID